MTRMILAAFAALAGTVVAPVTDAIAAPQDTVKPPATAPLPVEANPLVYVQRFRGVPDEILRTLSLFSDGRAMLTTRYLNNSIALVQTGRWEREAKANRFTVLLTRQNGKPIKSAAISFVGNPKRGGGTVSASGKTALDYGGYGLTMVPRAEDDLAYTLNNGTLRAEAVGVQPLEVSQVTTAIRTREGDIIYAATGGVGGYQNEGQTLYRFSTLIGKPRKLAAFPYRVAKITELRSASGRPALIVALTDGKFNRVRLAVIDPIRETTSKLWQDARLTGTSQGRITVSLPGGTRTFALDSVL